MDLIPTYLLVVLVFLGITGILAQPLALRIFCWVLALPSFAIGAVALVQGGIVEPFGYHQLIGFCAFTFTPAIGCTIGELLTFWQRKKKRQNNGFHGTR